MARALLIAVIGLTASSAAGGEIIWSTPDDRACEDARQELESGGIPPARVQEILRDDPLCQLSDREIVKHFEQLPPSARRIRDCSHFTIPRSSTIHFPPLQTGSNEVEARILHCSHDVERRSSDCSFEARSGLFTTDPTSYFFVKEPLSDRDALEVARLHDEQRLALLDQIRANLRRYVVRMDLESIGLTGEGFVLHLESCGCESRLEVRIVEEEQGRRLELVGSPSVICT